MNEDEEITLKDIIEAKRLLDESSMSLEEIDSFYSGPVWAFKEQGIEFADDFMDEEIVILGSDGSLRRYTDIN